MTQVQEWCIKDKLLDVPSQVMAQLSSAFKRFDLLAIIGHYLN